jgi:proteasome assembly chaperone (PAC2) family protein
MKFCLILAAVVAVSACGVETVGTAATGAVIKKQELEQGQKTMEQMQQKVDQMNQQAQQRAEQAGGER